MAARGQDEDYPIKPHPESQKLIEKWAAPPTIPGIEQQHYGILGPLSQLAARDGERFVQQVIYYAHHQEQNEQGGGRSILARSLIDLCQVPDSSVALALAPYLYGQHAPLRKSAWELFIGSLGEGYPRGYGDLSHIRGSIVGPRANPEIATPLKRAIFEVTPNSALSLFTAEWKESHRLARAVHALDNALFERNMSKALHIRIKAAKERGEPEADLPLASDWKLDEESIAALRELATSKHWWARMFASEFMVHNKEFRIPELIEKLEKDENDLVRQSALSITTPDPLRAPVGPVRP